MRRPNPGIIPPSIRDLPSRVPSEVYRRDPVVAAAGWGAAVGGGAALASGGRLTFGVAVGALIGYMLAARAQVGPVGQPIIMIDNSTPITPMEGYRRRPVVIDV